MMTDNKKSGIKLRYLEQNGPGEKRDLSPNTANRKKIFERVPAKKVLGARIDPPVQNTLEEKLRGPAPVVEQKKMPEHDDS